MGWGSLEGESGREKLVAWFLGMNAPDEDSREFDGFLSHVQEVHAAVLGFSLGLAFGIIGLGLALCVSLGLEGCKKSSRFGNRVAVREMRDQPWYAIAFAVIGFFTSRFLGIDPAAWLLF